MFISVPCRFDEDKTDLRLQALHNVFGPAGPFFHSSESTVLHVTHMYRAYSSICSLSASSPMDVSSQHYSAGQRWQCPHRLSPLSSPDLCRSRREGLPTGYVSANRPRFRFAILNLQPHLFDLDLLGLEFNIIMDQWLLPK